MKAIEVLLWWANGPYDFGRKLNSAFLPPDSTDVFLTFATNRFLISAYVCVGITKKPHFVVINKMLNGKSKKNRTL